MQCHDDAKFQVFFLNVLKNRRNKLESDLRNVIVIKLF